MSASSLITDLLMELTANSSEKLRILALLVQLLEKYQRAHKSDPAFDQRLRITDIKLTAEDVLEYSSFRMGPLSDCRFKSFFKFYPTEVWRLYNALGIPEILIDEFGECVNGIDALLLLLLRLRHPTRLCDVAQAFSGRSDDWAWRTFNLIIDYLYDKYGKLIEIHPAWDEGAMRLSATAMRDGGCPLPNVVGFLNRTGLEGGAEYCDQCRRCTSATVNDERLQFVTVPSGIVVHVFGPSKSNVPRFEALLESPLLRHLDQHAFDDSEGPLCVYDECAYGCMRHLCPPFRPPSDDEEQVFNDVMSKYRVAVEQPLGEALELFPLLDCERSRPHSIEKRAKIVLLLINCFICLNKRDNPPLAFPCQPPTLENYLGGYSVMEPVTSIAH